MKAKKSLIVLVVALVAVIAVAAIAYGALAPSVETQTVSSQDAADASSDESASAAPDFTMTSADGEEVTLAALEGKPMVLNFWASTCGPCRSEMPEFQSAYEEYGDQIQFVMVNVPDFNGESQERALQFAKQQGFTFPIYFDTTTEGQMLYGISSIPQTFFITADGKVAAYASGAIDGAALERGLERARAGYRGEIR